MLANKFNNKSKLYSEKMMYFTSVLADNYSRIILNESQTVCFPEFYINYRMKRLNGTDSFLCFDCTSKESCAISTPTSLHRKVFH